MNGIIKRKKSIVISCDCSYERYHEILKQTEDLDVVGGYKLGFMLGLSMGLHKVVEFTRKYFTDKPLIYDGQKAGTDIPYTGRSFAKTLKNAGIDAVILFPLSGPETERAYIEAAFEEDLGVIVGGLMTHQKYIRSQGGFIADESVLEMYGIAADIGVKNFVVPANKIDEIKSIKRFLESRVKEPIFYSPGFSLKETKLSEVSSIFNGGFHPIIGRDIHQAKDIKKVILEYSNQI